MGDYRKLKAWRIAHELTLRIYEATRGFPADERFALTQQLRRAAVSVAANIVEGQGRHGSAEAVRFARIAAGSLSEVDYLLLLSRELGYLPNQDYEQLLTVRKQASLVLGRLIESLEA